MTIKTMKIKTRMKNFIGGGIVAALLGLVVFTAPPAQALDLFSNGLGTAVSGQVGVSTPINNTPLYNPLGANGGADSDARNRYRYERDALERTMRQRAAIEDNSVKPYDIAPAAGHYYRKPAAVNMGAIQRGHSYND